MKAYIVAQKDGKPFFLINVEDICAINVYPQDGETLIYLRGGQVLSIDDPEGVFIPEVRRHWNALIDAEAETLFSTIEDETEQE